MQNLGENAFASLEIHSVENHRHENLDKRGNLCVAYLEFLGNFWSPIRSFLGISLSVNLEDKRAHQFIEKIRQLHGMAPVIGGVVIGIQGRKHLL